MKKYYIGFSIGLIFLCAIFIAVMVTVRNPEINFLPYYAFRSLLRITITFFISLGFSLFFGMLAVTNKYVNMIVVPFFDVLQSVPILGYFPAAIMFFISAFPNSQLGMELSAILLLFTSMVWAIFFGIIGAVRSLPSTVLEASEAFGIKGFNKIRHVILPAIVPALVTGGTLAWCDGWFFMIAAEYITYGGKKYSIPGLGSYLAKAAWEYNDINLSVILLVLITILVVFINFLTWHRLTEKIGTGAYKPIFKFHFESLRRVLPKRGEGWLHHLRLHSFFKFRHTTLTFSRPRKYTVKEKIITFSLVVLTVAIIIYTLSGKILNLEMILQAFSNPEITNLPIYTFYTIVRLTIAYVISLGIALTFGILTAEHKKFAKILYPIYDIGQSVPILALFPIFFLAISRTVGGRTGLEITSILILVLDMIWYMFLNIVSAVKNIPDEVREVAHLFGFKGIKRVTHIIIPSILPAIVTGSMLSWATGWNTVIFSEYMPYGSEVFTLPGIGYFLDKVAYEYGNTVLLILILALITTIVIFMEKFLWLRLLKKAEKYRTEV